MTKDREYKTGDARNYLIKLFSTFEEGTEAHIEVAKSLAVADAIEDLEGHLAEQIFRGTRKRA